MEGGEEKEVVMVVVGGFDTDDCTGAALVTISISQRLFATMKSGH